jgi:hypothetical protein
MIKAMEHTSFHDQPMAMWIVMVRLYRASRQDDLSFTCPDCAIDYDVANMWVDNEELNS